MFMQKKTTKNIYDRGFFIILALYKGKNEKVRAML